jgi:hypothetical protein
LRSSTLSGARFLLKEGAENNQMRNQSNLVKVIVAATMLLAMASCGSSGIGDVLGGGSGSNASRYELRGTVESVDTASRSIYLTNVSGLQSMLSSGGGNTVRVYYDNSTNVDYNGRSYRPEDLERGDQVTARVDESGNQLVAESMTVTYNSASGGGSYPSGNYPSNSSTIRGTVQSVDTSRRTITVDRGYGSTTFIEYATNTPVYYGSTTYRTSDLERGDEIEVRVDDLGSGRLSARDITVLRSVSSGTGSSTSSNLSTYRGTVRYIDTSRRTIELESTSWISGFNRGTAGTTVMTVQYDSNTNVDVSGRLYPISSLERGDVVDVQVQNGGSSLPFAQRIVLVRDINSR